SIVPIYVPAEQCGDLVIQHCSFTIDPSFKYSNTFSLPATIAAGTTDTFYIVFPTQGLTGTYILSVHLSGTYDDSSSEFDTTLNIRVTFNSSNGALVSNAPSLDLDTISTCSSGDTTVTLTNLGCNPITVTGDGTIWQPGWSASDPSFPLQLPPDSSFTVRVHFHPSVPIWLQQLVNFSFTDISHKAGASLPFALSVTVVPASASLWLTDTTLDLGTFSRCDASADTVVTLTNTGCDSLSLSGASVGAGSGFTLVNGADTMLAPQESVQYKIHFSDSITGSLSSALTVHAVGAHGGSVFDTSIAFSATIIPGSYFAALSTRAIDFGTTSICEERDSTIAISDTGCEPDTITQASFLSTQFVVDTIFPIVISPGETVTIPVSTNLDTSGHPVQVVDTLRFASNLDSALPPVALSRGVNYPGRFSLGLTTEDSAAISAIVPVYVLREGTIPKTANELDFDLIYDEDLLGFSKVMEPDIQPGNATLLPSGLTERSFAMKPATDRDTIATLEFQSYLAKQEHTPIMLANQKFLAGGAVSPPCVASMDSATDTGFTLELACGDGPLVSALTGLPLDLTAMNVSPDALNFTLDCGDATLTSCSADILNVLGVQAIQRTLELSPVTMASFDLHSLPAGAYFLRIAAGGSVITRRFVIIK
ncbi:MAG: choice-of-anchor D domain-containing protein, partial [Candidatus Kapaibacterium sp.]